MTRRSQQRAGWAIALWAMLVGGCGAPDECQRGAEAAYRALQSSGRPYRVEVTWIPADAGPAVTFEFVPPDRRRAINLFGQGETFIEVGKQAWVRPPDGPWHELPDEVRPIRIAYDWPNPQTTRYSCLEPVEVQGKTYTGYRAPYTPKTVVTLRIAPRDEDPPPATRREVGPLWMTVLVDPGTGLPAHEIVAPEGAVTQPEQRSIYAYPSDLVINPPAQ